MVIIHTADSGFPLWQEFGIMAYGARTAGPSREALTLLLRYAALQSDCIDARFTISARSIAAMSGRASRHIFTLFEHRLSSKEALHV
ncbi:hypothetical protein D8780_06460 [Notoacmeibacter ruber]|uniref:Uncharacterized protein n=1 Tax=Notoacmeibacter ruber TaxID=2670375 RepID=A0A3L7JBU6_9HYPH|nr:hypothetical protein D8780_06460 [Notoacmeibacter ruber]